MKKLSLLFIFCFFLNLSAAEKIPLSLKFTKGEKYEMGIDVDLKGSMSLTSTNPKVVNYLPETESKEQKAEGEALISYLIDLDVLKTYADGSADIRLLPSKVRFFLKGDLNGQGGEFEYTLLKDELEEIGARLPNQLLTVSPAGDIIVAEEQEIDTFLEKSLVDIKDVLKEQNVFIDTQKIKDIVKFHFIFFMKYPAQNVGVGDEWRYAFDLSEVVLPTSAPKVLALNENIKISGSETYKVEKREGGVVTVSYRNQPEIDIDLTKTALEVPYKFRLDSSEIETTLLLDEKTGFLESSNGHIRFVGEMGEESEEGITKIPFELEMEAAVNLKKVGKE